MQKSYPILKFFEYDHLPAHLQELSKPFHDLAYDMYDKLIDKGGATAVASPAEIEAGLRHLLEAKDCFVRAALK